MRYFEDKAVDPPKRRTRGEEIAKSLADAMPLILFAARKEDICYCTENYTCNLHKGDDASDDGKDKATDISCYYLCNHVQHVCGLFGVQDGGHGDTHGYRGWHLWVPWWR